MNRRELIQGAGAVMIAALSAEALAQAKAQEHDHHHHGGNANQALIESAAHCLMAGQACVQHCLVLLGKGDKEMAACAMSVQQMMAACDALQKLASYNSPHLKKMAKVALDVCVDCEKECRKHEKKHAECKACADACAACSKECKKLAV